MADTITAEQAYETLTHPSNLSDVQAFLRSGHLVLVAVNTRKQAVFRLDDETTSWIPSVEEPFAVFFNPSTDKPRDVKEKLDWWLEQRKADEADRNGPTQLDPELYRDDDFRVVLDGDGDVRITVTHAPGGKEWDFFPLCADDDALRSAETLILRLVGALQGYRRRLAMYEGDA